MMVIIISNTIEHKLYAFDWDIKDIEDYLTTTFPTAQCIDIRDCDEDYVYIRVNDVNYKLPVYGDIEEVV